MSGDTPDYSSTSVPGSYDQYEKPTDATGKNQGDSWWKGIPVLGPGVSLATNLMGGDQYVNEADPSWEDVITMVVIPGQPDHIRNAAGIWGILFNRIEQAKKLLDDGIGDLKTWEGAAGETYRNHLSSVSKSLGEMIDKHQTIKVSLETSATNLSTAIDKIPIPDDMIHEVMAAKQDFFKNGKGSPFGKDSIFNTLLPVYGNKWVDELRETFSWGWAEHKLRDWISTQDDDAKKAYHSLATQHVSTMDGMPQGSQLSYSNPTDQNVPLPPNTPPGTPPGSVPKTSLPHQTTPKTTLPTTNPNSLNPHTTPNPSISPTTVPSHSGIGSGSGLGGSGIDPGTGLAGAGGGLTGAGAGGLGAGGGVGGLPGAGTGAGGLGAAGAGSGLPGAGAGLAGGLPGAGMAGAGRGGRMGGMMGGAGGHGGQEAGDGDEHSTWLNEDEDIWGSDTDAAPPVLGA